MVQRKRKDCPVPGCYTSSLLKLSNHFASVHGLNSNERKTWLERARIKHISHNLPRNDLVFNQPPSAMDVSFKNPTNIQVCGPTCCGKSYWTENLLRHAGELFTHPIQKIVYCYGEFQPRFLIMEREIPNLQFIQGFPEDIYSLFDKNQGLLVLDDLMRESSTNDAMMNLITRGCHHSNISTIFLVQNMFSGNKHSRTISLNTHYIACFKKPRDSLGVSTLARQAFPRAVPYVMESFEDATKQPYGYLLFDLHPSTPDNIRLRTSIFPDEQQVAYVKRI